jgi:hypothetical protein
LTLAVDQFYVMAWHGRQREYLVVDRSSPGLPFTKLICHCMNLVLMHTVTFSMEEIKKLMVIYSYT